MAETKPADKGQTISRDQLADLLNEDLSREYQAVIAYVVYSQVIKGAEFMSIAQQLEEHATQELQHALIISRQIDYLGKMPTVNAIGRSVPLLLAVAGRALALITRRPRLRRRSHASA